MRQTREREREEGNKGRCSTIQALTTWKEEIDKLDIQWMISLSNNSNTHCIHTTHSHVQSILNSPFMKKQLLPTSTLFFFRMMMKRRRQEKHNKINHEKRSQGDEEESEKNDCDWKAWKEYEVQAEDQEVFKGINRTTNEGKEGRSITTDFLSHLPRCTCPWPSASHSSSSSSRFMSHLSTSSIPFSSFIVLWEKEKELESKLVSVHTAYQSNERRSNEIALNNNNYNVHSLLLFALNKELGITLLLMRIDISSLIFPSYLSLSYPIIFLSLQTRRTLVMNSFLISKRCIFWHT